MTTIQPTTARLALALDPLMASEELNGTAYKSPDVMRVAGIDRSA